MVCTNSMITILYLHNMFTCLVNTTLCIVAICACICESLKRLYNDFIDKNVIAYIYVRWYSTNLCLMFIFIWYSLFIPIKVLLRTEQFSTKQTSIAHNFFKKKEILIAKISNEIKSFSQYVHIRLSRSNFLLETLLILCKLSHWK